MIVYFCDACNNGQLLLEEDVPQDERCPKCNTYLTMKVISSDKEEYGEESLRYSVERYSEEKYISGLEKADNQEALIKKERSLDGRVIGASSDAFFIRNPLSKFCEKLKYHQRVSDIQNTIILRSKDENTGEKDTRVIFYGIVKGGMGEFTVGVPISAWGKYNSKNEFVAEKVVVESDTLISLKYEMKDFWYLVIPITLPILLWFVSYNFQDLRSKLGCTLNKELFIGVAVIWIISLTVISKIVKKVTNWRFLKRTIIGLGISLLLFIAILVVV